jgi:DNA-binding response OmpR family regulator
MLTSRSASATRVAPKPGGLVVSFQLSESGAAGNAPDLHRLARAVEDLIRAAAPAVISSVSIEAIPPRPAATVHPRLAAAAAAAHEIDLDTESRTLRVDGSAVELTRREFDLLVHLQQHRGQAFSREELMTAVWQTAYLAGDRTVDVHVRRLRVKLGRHAERLSTLRGFGYRFD